jgi:hypothetical protein
VSENWEDTNKDGDLDDDGDVVWKQTVDDGEYQCSVTRVDGYLGELKIVNDGVVIHHEQVGMAYGAVFGPDMDDVATWQERCIFVIDNVGERVL